MIERMPIMLRSANCFRGEKHFAESKQGIKKTRAKQSLYLLLVFYKQVVTSRLASWFPPLVLHKRIEPQLARDC